MMIGALADWELTRSGRSGRMYGVRIAALTFAFAPFLMGWLGTVQSSMSANDRINAWSSYANSSINLFQLFVAVLGAPIIASMAFTDERQSGTLDLLVLSGTRWPVVVLTKFISVFSQVVLLLLAILPFAAIGALLGGIDVVVFTERTAALSALSFVVCAAGVLGSAGSTRWESSLIRTGLFVGLYVVIAEVPDRLSGRMLGTSGNYLIGSGFGPISGSTTWESMAMAVGVGCLFLLQAGLRIPVVRPVRFGWLFRRRSRRKRIPNSAYWALRALTEYNSVRAALPWARSRLRLIGFALLLIPLARSDSFAILIFLGLPAYASAAGVYQLAVSGSMSAMRLASDDAKFARMVVWIQLQWGSIFCVVFLVSELLNDLAGSTNFVLSNSVLMVGFMALIISLATLASTFRGGVAIHSLIAFGLSYLLMLALMSLAGMFFGRGFGRTGTEEMGMGGVAALALSGAMLFLFMRRFPARMPAG